MKNIPSKNKKEDRWVDVHNDDVMRSMGFFRPFDQSPRDISVWTKTLKERKLLNSMKCKGKSNNGHFYNIPNKHIPVKAKLIIQLKRNKKYNKSTYSMICWMNEIPEILSQYQISNPKTKRSESIIVKYSFNGKTYSPNELPFWG